MLNKDKLAVSKIILVLIILLSLSTVLGVTAYSLSIKKTPPVAFQPTVEPAIVPTPKSTLEAISPPAQQQSPIPSITPENNFENLLLSLPFHNSNKVLRVYTPKPSPDVCINIDELYCIGKGLSVSDTTLSLTVYDTKNKSSIFVGNIQPVSYTGNSGGLFVPFAITKDDSKIILEANMGDPGAGGGSVNYGYVMIPIKPAPNEDWVISDFLPVANSSVVDFPLAGDFAHFYDSYDKVVYADESDKSPHYSPPPYSSNDGKIMFRNLVTGEVKKLIEETDTSYEIIGLDEKNQILKFKAIKYTFSKDCPREDDAFSCAESSVTERSISLP